jgi:glycosyltransferase involved in cell wall biosynthesis
MKPKLLIIHNRLVVGGPALDTIPLAYHLRNDFDIHILYGNKEDDETEPSFLLEKYKGLKLVRISSLQRSPHPIKDFLSYKAIKKYILSFKPDIIHTHGAKVGLFGRLAASSAKVPFILHTFHGHLFHSYFNRFLSGTLVYVEKWLLKLTHHIIAISKTQKQELESILKIRDTDKVKLIPLGVDYIDQPMQPHYKQAFRRTYKLDEESVCIGLLGRLVPIKNTSFFIDVVEQVLNKSSLRIRFFVVGDGHEKNVMMDRLQQKKITFTESAHEDAPVVFTSWVQNIQNILAGLDIVVLTSHNEGTPMSLIEAQLAGKPVVAMNVGGVKDTMIAGETGFLIEKHIVNDFAEAVITLAENTSLRKEMGEKAKLFAVQAFSKDNEVNSLRSLYNRYKE